MHRLRMRDFWTFKPKEVMENKRHLFECKDSSSETGNSLLVKVAATHAGVVNSNHRFYRPDRMQDASYQWVPENGKYPKPVLLEHDQKGDVLGRVRTARYVDESYKWSGDFPTIKDSIFYDKKVDLFKSVDWIVENLMPLKDYSGLGYLELGLNVTNPDAIAKVLRDEYLTVSVGFQTDSAVCSVCHQDWASDDKCDHRPGSRDEESGKVAFLICGDFKYEELSFVNFPADPFAGKISKDALKDSLNRKFFMGLSHAKQQAFAAAAGMSMSDAVMDYDVQIVEDIVATAYDLTKIDQIVLFEGEVKSDSLTAARALELKQNLQDWKPETDELKTRKRSITSTLNAKVKKNNWAGVAAEAKDATADEVAAALSDKKADCACGKADKSECGCDTIDWSKEQLTDEEKSYFEDEEGLYNELCLEMDEAVKAGELPAEVVADAKLSTEKRGKLSGSTFCGPNRSFPVPDCAHVTAARRLIGRYKGGSKDKILACVSRKASTLGCGISKKDEITPQVAEKPNTIQGQDADIQRFVDEAKMGNCAAEVLSSYDGLNKHYKGADDDLKGRMRHLHYQVGEHWSSASALEWAREHLKAAKDEVLIPSKDLAEKEEAINSLTDEVKTAADAVAAAKATSGEMLKAVKKSLASQIVIYKSLTGNADFKDLTPEQRIAKVDELSKRHVTSLKDAVADIMAELKWVEPAEAKPADKVIEPGKSVADNAQIETPAAAVKTDAEAEAERVKNQQVADAALRDRLSAMTAKERKIYLADLAYNDSKPATK